MFCAQIHCVFFCVIGIMLVQGFSLCISLVTFALPESLRMADVDIILVLSLALCIQSEIKWTYVLIII